MRNDCNKLILLLVLLCGLVSATRTSGSSSKQGQQNGPQEQKEPASKKQRYSNPEASLKARQECHHVKFFYGAFVRNEEALYVFSEKLKHKIRQDDVRPVGPFASPLLPEPPLFPMDLTICNETCAIKVQQFGRTLKSFISEGTGKSIARHCWNSVQMSLSHREITLYDCGPACEYRIPSLCQCSFTLEIYSKYKKSITDLRSEMTTGEVRGGGRKPPDSPLVKCESGRFSKAIIENIVIGQHWRLLGVEEVKDVPCRKSSTRPPSDFRVPPETWCRCNNLDRNKQRQDCDHENVECWREFWVGREKRVERVSPAEVISAAAIANDEFDQKSWQRMLLGLNLNELVERAASSEERTEELR